MITKRVVVNMDQKKQIQVMSKKMNSSQILFDLVPIIFYTNNSIKYQQQLGITSQMFYFMHNHHIKKIIPISTVNLITLSAHSQEVVLHCEEEDIRISSFQNAKIFKNILKVRQKILNNNQQLTVLLQKEKSLGKYSGQEEKKRGFFSNLFGRQSNEKNRSSITSSSRNSLCKLLVSDKTFLLQIGKNIYNIRSQNNQLLYISGGRGFFFQEQQHIKEQVNRKTFIFKNKVNKQQFIMHKIKKQNKVFTNSLRQYLKNFKLKNSQQEILYATESQFYFQIISPYSPRQFTLEHAIQCQKSISQIDLLSIFFKLMGVIDAENQVYCSLRPKHIIMKENIVIQSVFCINKNEININYLAPEQLDPTIALNFDVQLINFWKIGMVLYQIAFHKEPFPIQHLADVVAHNKNIKLYYPPSNKTQQFKQFLSQILIVQPGRRGGDNYKKKIFDHKWIKQTMR